MNKIVFNYNLGSIKRKFPMNWDCETNGSFSTPNALVNFSNYVGNMHNALLRIKEFYEEEFNIDNFNNIDDYIDFFNITIRKIDKILLRKDCLKVCKDEDYKFNQMESFCITSATQFYKINKELLVLNKKNMTFSGIKYKTYKKLVPLTKKIFMIEKMCSFTTRKFWEKEITPIENFNPKEPYKLIVRVMIPENWRKYEETTEATKYFNEKIYASASLIDENHSKKLINYYEWHNKLAALLILDYDQNTFLCANEGDAFSEEYINKKIPPLKRPDRYSKVNLVDKEKKDDDLHEFYAQAVEITTPKGLLKNVWNFTEVDIKNPKVVGVISPNPESKEYASQFAEQYSVPLFDMDLTSIINKKM